MFLHALRPVRGGCVSAETQTDLLIVERGQPVVNFLDSAECPFDDDVPNCFRLGLCPVVIIEGVRLTMLLDIGAEVMILSSDLLHRLFPGQDFPDKDGVSDPWVATISIKGPVSLPRRRLTHSFASSCVLLRQCSDSLAPDLRLSRLPPVCACVCVCVCLYVCIRVCAVSAVSDMRLQ